MDPTSETTKPGEGQGEAEALQQQAEIEQQEAPDSTAPDPAEETLKAILGEEESEAETPAPEAQEVAKQAAVPELSKPGTQQPAPDPAKDEAKAKVDAEVKELGLKEKAEQRFRDLSAKAAEAEQLRPVAERLQQWEERILSTGANPEQFGHAMNYLTLVNSGDPANIELAFQQIEGEYLALAKALGKAVGGADPLTEHPDLAQKVERLEIDRETALEMAGMRAQMRLRDASAQHRSQQDQQLTAHQNGQRDLALLERELRLVDPAGYDAKLAALRPALQQAIQTLPPDRWAGFARQLFATIPAIAPPAPAPVPPPARSGIAPLRTTIPGATPVRKVEDEAEATLAAMLSVGRRGA